MRSSLPAAVAVDSCGRPFHTATSDWPRPPRPTPRRAGAAYFPIWMVPVAAALLVPGCLPLAIGGAAGMLGGERAPASSGSAEMPSGSGVPHARRADRSIGEALAASEGDVRETCRSLLPERSTEDAATKRTCGFRLICLPRAHAPTRLYVCERTAQGEP